MGINRAKWLTPLFILGLLFQNCSQFRALQKTQISSTQTPPATQIPDLPNPPPPVVSSGDPICGAKPDPSFPKFPNEPTQYQRMVDWGFDSIAGQGLADAYPDPEKKYHFITQCNDAPVSPSSVLKSLRPAADNGNGGIQMDYYQRMFDEVYVGLVWKANPNFEGGYSNRLFIILTGGIQGYVSWGKYEFKTLDEGYIGFTPIAGTNVDNCHLVPGDRFCQPGSMNLPPNIKPDHVVARNKWHLVESVMRRSSAPGRKDGRIRWWVNGELVGDYIGLDSGGNPINDISYQQGWVDRKLTRDGPQANDWYYLVDHIRISGI